MTEYKFEASKKLDKKLKMICNKAGMSFQDFLESLINEMSFQDFLESLINEMYKAVKNGDLVFENGTEVTEK